jgi:hypothetical protein
MEPDWGATRPIKKLEDVLIHCEAPRVPCQKLSDDRGGETSAAKAGVGQKDQKYKSFMYFRVNSGWTVSST